MIVIDIEASGTNYEKTLYRLTGAVDLAEPTRQFYGECQIWPGAHIMDEALAVNGYTEAEITDSHKQSEAELVRTFIEWSQHMSDRTLAGQNVSFDRDMLKAGCERAGINYDFAYRTIDTHSLCWMHMIKRD